jgi:hypothetical protein
VWEFVDGLEETKYRVLWWDFLNAVMNLLVP